jgi:hypothetical protein
LLRLFTSCGCIAIWEHTFLHRFIPLGVLEKLLY